MIKQKLSPIYFILFFLVLLAPATLQAKVYIDLEAPSIRQLPFQIQADVLTLDVRLFDCLRERLILGKRYIGSISNPRKLSHYFADKLSEELTGRKGIFTTKMLFISNATGNKEVYASDYDGKNV